ncbi:MAG: response regulator [Pseudomonadota bacterium]
MVNLHTLIKKRLSAKILIALTFCVAIVMAGVIILAVTSQRRQLQEQMTEHGRELKSVAYTAIRHPMAMGDSASVKQQLTELRESLRDNEIVICDFNQQIVFASHAERIGTSMAEFTANRKVLAGMARLLTAEQTQANQAFEEERDGHRYLLTLHPLVNQKECHHCHGESRKVLGSLVIRLTTDKTYSAISALRDRTIAISLLGICAIILLTHLLLTKMVIRPVEELAEKSRQIAHGDLDASVTVRSDDAIGSLANSFNIMATSVKEQIGYFNSLRAAIAAPLFIVDPGMVITYMNEACEKLSGYSKEETEGQLTCREVFKSDRCGTATCPLHYCLERGVTVEGITAIITTRAGKKVPIMTSASALIDMHGKVIGAVEICKDISDVLEAERLRYIKKTAEHEEEQRQYLEERVRELLAVLSRVAGGNLKTRAEERGKGDVMDQIARHINLTLDNLEKLYARISSFNKELEQEVDRRTVLLREQTVLLERANRELRELDKLKSAFLANMSHELRTPMNSIIGYTDLLIDRVDGEINDEQEKSLLKVHNNARHLLQLINDILDMAKIESGKIELDPRPVDIQALTESVATIFEPTMTKKGLTLVRNFAAGLEQVYIDEDKVRQIFINLLSNAVKFTEKGMITIHIQPSPTAERFIQVCIEDSGIGIRGEDMGKLFDKFSQVDGSTVRQYEGTGLGLCIARGLVVLHKGKIWVESTFGQGCRFCFTLPTDGKLLEKPAEPILDTTLADRLATAFNGSPQIFSQVADFGGKPIRCWEFCHCGQPSCPAYSNKELRCWLIQGTHCKGEKIAFDAEKTACCHKCEIIERLLLADEEHKAGAVINLPLPDNTRSPKKVLVIDDNPEVIELVRKYAGDEFQIVGLLNGHDAVRMAMELRPVAITLDIMMPGKDGWQVLHELKQNPATQDIPVVILSIVDNKKLGFSLGAAEYLVKPIDKKLLLRKLKSLEKMRPSIKKILVVDNDRHALDTICRLLDEGGYEIECAQNHADAADALACQPPDLIVFNPFMPAPEGIDLIEPIKTNPRTMHIPLILITQQQMAEYAMKNLNDRIRAILDKGLRNEDGLLKELMETFKKCD